MDIYTRFNTKNIQDRQIDTLIGLSKGLIADGKVVQSEAEFLLGWLIQNKNSCNNPIIINLLDKVSEMLEDGILDDQESADLMDILKSISGENSEIGELSKTAYLPVCKPAPKIHFENSSFLFTGTCAFGNRKRCHEATENLGGIPAKSVTKSMNYLVLGTYVTDSWAHESFGRKIEKAMEYRESGSPISIVTEAHWAKEGNIIT